MKKLIQVILFLLPTTHLMGQPYTYFDRFPERNCDTSGLYDSKTRASFFGDSRIHLADGRLAPLFGLDVYAFGNPAGLDFFLRGAGDDWNVQNLAMSGYTSAAQDAWDKESVNEALRLHERMRRLAIDELRRRQ